MPRAPFLLLALASSVAMTRSEPVIRARVEGVSRVTATAIPLDTEGGRDRVGGLRYVEGHVLTSADPRFGGISAMALTPRGFLALSDSGTVLRLDGPNRVPATVRLTPLLRGPGNGDKKSDRDSEAMALHAGRAWVTYERHNAVWRYADDFTRVEARRAPPQMKDWRANSGAEGMVRLPDGRFLIFSESRGGVARSSELLLFDRDPTDARARVASLAYRLPEGFRVTDAALLGDGRVLTLHRSVSLMDGLVASVGIADLSAMVAGAVVTPRIVATLRPPINVDNMEALAIERRGAATHIWMASDDNFSSLQRTLLLHFVLEER